MITNRSHRSFRLRRPLADFPILRRCHRLRFAGIYAYSPKGESEVSRRSRELCGRVKNGSATWMKSYAARARRELADDRRFQDFFSAQSVLIPVPECGAGRTPRGVARRLAMILCELGLGGDVWNGLRRIHPVERSSMAWIGERPTVQQHYQSFAVIPSSNPPREIVLVDDVVTKGRTLMAAAMRLSEAFPGATVRAFALIRTLGFVVDVDRIFDPCLGEIRWNGRDAYREP